MRPRLLIVVTHLLGAGHLTRAAAIARACARAGHEVTLVSGGMPNGLVKTEGVEVVQLPPVRTAVGAFTRLLDEDGWPVAPARLAERRDRLAGLVQAARPDVLVTELFPFGRRVLAAEFSAALDAAGPGTAIACSIRDVLAAPSTPAKVIASHVLLAQRYRAVLVHGDEELLPLDRSWPLDPPTRARLRYTGYIDAEPAPARSGPDVADGVLVSGGSSAAALPLYRAALAAAAADPARPWRVLVGGGVAATDYENLRRSASGNAAVERTRPDFRELLARAAVFVGQAGYNTVMDIVATRSRAVLVPFEQGGETEQRLRAGELARRGLVEMLPEGELDAARLGRLVRRAATRPRPVFDGVNRNGAVRSATILTELAGGRGATP